MLASSPLAPVKASVVSIVDVVSVIDGDTVEFKTGGALQRLRLGWGAKSGLVKPVR